MRKTLFAFATVASLACGNVNAQEQLAAVAPNDNAKTTTAPAFDCASEQQSIAARFSELSNASNNKKVNEKNVCPEYFQELAKVNQRSASFVEFCYAGLPNMTKESAKQMASEFRKKAEHAQKCEM